MRRVALLVVVSLLLWACTGGAVLTTTTKTAPTSTTTRAGAFIWTEAVVCEALPFATEPLPEAAGNYLIILTKSGEILRLDLGSGRLSCVRPVSITAPDRPPWVWGLGFASHIGSGTFVQNGTTWFVPDDPSLPAQELNENGSSYVPAVAPDTVWQFISGKPGDTVRLLDLAAGRPVSDVTIPSEGWVRVGDGAGQLIVKTRTAFYALAPDGTITTLWEGDDLLTANATTVLARVCETAFSCNLVTVDRRISERTELGVAPPELTLVNPIRAIDPAPLQGVTAIGLTLSPDGTLLAAIGFDLEQDAYSGLLIFDLRTGEKHKPSAGLVGAVSGFSWSDDGSMLFWVDSDGATRLWRRDQPAEANLLAPEILPPAIGVAIEN